MGTRGEWERVVETGGTLSGGHMTTMTRESTNGWTWSEVRVLAMN